jgi:hypothetical protein
LPITAYRCKFPEHCPGKGAIFDTFHAIVHQNDWTTTCPYCKGEALRAEQCSVPVDVSLITKSANSSYRGVFHDESHYRMNAIVAGTTFVGTIRGEVAPQELQMVLSDGLWVGGKITSGFGKVTAQIRNEMIIEKESREDFRTRCDYFADCFGIERRFIVMTLHSDAILSPQVTYMESNERYLENLEKALFPLTMFPEGEIRLVKAIAEYEYRRGYDTSKGVNAQKPIRLVMKAGAVLMIEVLQDSVECIEALARVAEWGVGQESENGYGKIVIADPFHIQKGELK